MQTRANVPLELMYVIVPLLMIAVLFRWTVTDVAAIKDVSGDADVHIQAIGKQWAWDFNYLDDDVYSAGVQAKLTGRARSRRRPSPRCICPWTSPSTFS